LKSEQHTTHAKSIYNNKKKIEYDKLSTEEAQTSHGEEWWRSCGGSVQPMLTETSKVM
jgi:hypothetical protein